jgi:hypothetical protein
MSGDPLAALAPLRRELAAAAADVGYRHDDPAAPWALFGSGVLLLHGLRDRIGDVDLFVAPTIWSVFASRAGWERRAPDRRDPAFLERELAGRRVCLFHSWSSRDPVVDAEQCRRAAERRAGWWATPLALVRAHKEAALAVRPDDRRQDKHRRDCEAIDAYVAAKRGSATVAWRGEFEALCEAFGELYGRHSALLVQQQNTERNLVIARAQVTDLTKSRDRYRAQANDEVARRLARERREERDRTLALAEVDAA